MSLTCSLNLVCMFVVVLSLQFQSLTVDPDLPTQRHSTEGTISMEYQNNHLRQEKLKIRPCATMASCGWEALEQRVIVQPAGGTWSMDRSGANEDTYALLVIWILDAESTYLPFTSILRFSAMASG